MVRVGHLRTGLLSAAIFLALAVGLAYGAKLTTKSTTATLPADGETQSVTTKCPKGKKATGGGIQVGAPGEDLVDGSHPDGGRKWTALGFRSTFFPEDSELTAFARCLKGAAVKTSSATVTLPGDETPYSAAAKCPRGTKVVGGGIELGDPDGDGVQGFYPTGKREWTATGSRGEAGDSELTAIARCLEGARVTRRAQTEPLLDDEIPHSATAKCPKGTKATGGGVEPEPVGMSLRGSYPVGKRKWTAIGRVVAAGDTELTAHVLCLKKPRKR